MIDPELVEYAVTQEGLSFVCAMCEHYWDARDAGSYHCGKLECGGPMSGHSFPDYKGPIAGDKWSDFCFVCGCPDDLDGVRVILGGPTGPGIRTLGVCPTHRGLLDELTPAQAHAQGIQVMRDHKVLVISRSRHGDAREAGQGH